MHAGEPFAGRARVALAIVVVALAAAAPAAAAPSTGLVVNEVYGGGGNSGATYTNDFIEIAKGGDQSADGRFQFPAQSSAVQRAGQAQVVHDFVAKILDVDKKADVVVLGDLNDYQFSPALAALRTGTADGSGTSILSDLITTLPVDQRYTYVFNGVSQVLDHILVAPGVGGVQYQVVHVNAEYADQASDHDPQVVRLQP